MKRKTCEFRNWILFVGLYDEGTVRRRVAVDRSGIDINEGNDLTKIQSGETHDLWNAIINLTWCT